MQISRLGEFGLIHLIKKWVGKDEGVIVSIGDDAAVVPYKKNQYLLFTTDMLAEGVHFKRKMNPMLIGHKALAVNISDIAAMGGIPLYAVVSLGAPKKISVHFIKNIYKGINKLGKRFGVSIVGGDTIRCDKIIINIALIGGVKRKHLVTRLGVRPGDEIFVTGPLGRSYLTGRHLSFTPRIQESQYLVKYFKPTSMIDISDGLLADLNHILTINKVGALLKETQIPLRAQASLKEALSDGEDFELLFTLSRREAQRLKGLKFNKMHFYPIGSIVRKQTLQLVDKKGQLKKMKVKGFTHF